MCSNPSSSLKMAFELDFSDLGPGPTPLADSTKLRQKVYLAEGQMGALVASYEAGSSTKELAAHLGIHRTTVATYLKQRGVDLRLGPLGESDTALALELYASGLSTARVAERIGRAPNTVRSALLAAGVRMRDARGMVR
jgi:DNA-binding CsgD family transcriptional regulator